MTEVSSGLEHRSDFPKLKLTHPVSFLRFWPVKINSSNPHMHDSGELILTCQHRKVEIIEIAFSISAS
jgi:hypothetical protein